MKKYKVEVHGNRNSNGYTKIIGYTIDADSHELVNKILSFYINEGLNRNLIRNDYLGDFYVSITWENIEEEDEINEIELE